MAGELITRDGQIEWRGLLMGVDTVYARQSLSGWLDLPGLDDASALRSGDHGADVGQLLAQPRIVEAGLQLAAPGDTGPVEDLLAVAGLRQVEDPLVVRAHGRTLLAYARLTKRAIPMDRLFAVGVGKVALAWSCSDPRRYALDEQSASTGLPTAEAGLDWGTTPAGLDWDTPPGGLDWGGGNVSGDLSCTNSGDAPAHPVIEFAGPVQTPSLTNLATGQVLEYDLPLAVGDTLTVDTAAGTVLLGTADRLYTVTARSVPERTFTLDPGETSLAFRSLDASPVAGTVTVRWRSAYW